METALETPADTPAPQRVPQGSPRAWLKLFIGALFVIGVTATFSYIMSGNDKQPPKASAWTFQFADDFERAATTKGLGTAGGTTWQTVSGIWGIQTGVVFVPFPDPALNVTIVDIGTATQNVQALVGGDGQCGLVARFVDTKNYVALFRVSAYAVWNLVQVVNGIETVIAKLPDSANNNLGVTLAVGDDIINAGVGFAKVTLVTHIVPRGTKGGLLARGGAGTCTWDSFVAFQGK